MVSICSLSQVFQSLNQFFCRLFQVHWLQLEPPSPLYSIVFFSSSLGLNICLPLHFLLLLLCGLLGQQSPLFGRFSFFCKLSPGLVVWPRLGDLFVSENPRKFCVSHFSGWYWFVHIRFVCIVKFKFLVQFPVDHLPTQLRLVLFPIMRSFSSSSDFLKKMCWILRKLMFHSLFIYVGKYNSILRLFEYTLYIYIYICMYVCMYFKNSSAS